MPPHSTRRPLSKPADLKAWLAVIKEAHSTRGEVELKLRASLMRRVKSEVNATETALRRQLEDLVAHSKEMRASSEDQAYNRPQVLLTMREKEAELARVVAFKKKYRL